MDNFEKKKRVELALGKKKTVINYSELARRVNLSPKAFELKLKKVGYNKFSTEQIKAIKKALKAGVKEFLKPLQLLTFTFILFSLL